VECFGHTTFALHSGSLPLPSRKAVGGDVEVVLVALAGELFNSDADRKLPPRLYINPNADRLCGPT